MTSPSSEPSPNEPSPNEPSPNEPSPNEPSPNGPSPSSKSGRPSVAPVVVGVFPGQPPKVVKVAAEVARWANAELICGYADTIGTGQVMPDGTIVPLVLATEPEPEDQQPDPELLDRLHTQLADSPIRWRVRELVGDPAEALTEIAEEESAQMIVVGTRQPGFAGTIREFFNGSVAVRLAHRQARPVLVVPLSPVSTDDDLPWSDSDDMH